MSPEYAPRSANLLLDILRSTAAGNCARAHVPWEVNRGYAISTGNSAFAIIIEERTNGGRHRIFCSRGYLAAGALCAGLESRPDVSCSSFPLSFPSQHSSDSCFPCGQAFDIGGTLHCPARGAIGHPAPAICP